jgi:hypothetical protein
VTADPSRPTCPPPVPDSWGQIFDDPTVAMLARLLHRFVLFNIYGESYRMRSHRASAETLRNAATTRNT